MFPQAHAPRAAAALGKPLLPLATDLGAVAQSFDNAGGIEDVMRFIYYYAGAVNGEDSLGHYIRALVEISTCTPRTSTADATCAAKFSSGSAAAAQAASASDRAVRPQQSAAMSDTSATSLTPLLRYLLGR